MNQPTTNLEQLMQPYRKRINQRLIQWLPHEDTTPEKLHQAMHYAVLNGGKRMRPLLVYTTGLALGATHSILDIPAASIELIHCYSLVHDDLPAMDDDDLRRGKPTCHKAFDEATAILVGDALQALAFELLASERSKPQLPLQLQMIKVLANACGSIGMVGGQSIDLEAEGQVIDVLELQTMHRKKTGALIRASVRLGALAAGCNDQSTLNLLDHFATDIGLAFQIQDDILDLIGTTEKLGKTARADQAHDKNTYPAKVGLNRAKQEVLTLSQRAESTLNDLPYDMKQLAQLCQYLSLRQY